MTESAELHCRRCGRVFPVFEYRCGACRKFHRSLVIPFAAGGALMFAVLAGTVFMTKVVPTHAQLFAGTGARFPRLSQAVTQLGHLFDGWAGLAALAFLFGVPIAGLAILPRRIHGLRPVLAGSVLLSFIICLMLWILVSQAPFPAEQPGAR